jgi:hypothetical protein
LVSKGKNVAGGLMELKNIGKRVVEMSTSSEPVHQELLKLSGSKDPAQQFPYFRFNVQRGMDGIGLEEWKAMVRIEELTSRYMAEADMERTKKACAEILWKPPQVERM